MLAALVVAFLPTLTQGLLGPLDPWSKSSADRSRVILVDPEERRGWGPAHTVLRDGEGRKLWERELPYTLRDAEITAKGEVLGWTYRGATEEAKSRLGLVILEPAGKERAIEWIEDPKDWRVRGIVAVPQSDRVIFRLEESVDSFCGTYLLERALSDREEWRSVRLSDGLPLARFVPPVIQRAGYASIARIEALHDRPLLCSETYFGDVKQAVVTVLDLEGREVWRHVETQEWRQPKAFHEWRFTAGRLASDPAPGEFTFQRSLPDERIRWRVEAEPDGLGPWRVTELSREARKPVFVSVSGVAIPVEFTPRVLSERRLVALTAGHPCPIGTWSDAALDARGELLVLEAEDAHLHRFDAQGAALDTIEIQEAGKAVDHILGVRTNRFDLAVGDSFATWDGKGERLTLAYDNRHHAFARPASHAIEGARWFLGTHEVLRCADDDPQGAAVARIDRHPDGTWFGELKAAAVAQDGSLATIDVPSTRWNTGLAEFTLSRYDAGGKGRDQFRARLGSAQYLSTRGRWLAGNGYGQASCFLADLDAQRLYSLGGEFKSWNYRVLLPPAEGEFWIVDLAGKRLLRAALPER